MKILKLRTSLQFGLWLKSLTTLEFCNLSGCPVPNVKNGVNAFLQADAIKLRLRYDYDKFLLQEITEEMRKNTILNPDIEAEEVVKTNPAIYDSDEYAKALLEYEQGKKKVIFKTFLTGDYVLAQGVKTLEDLATFTKGTLKLKNVNID